MNEDEDSNSEDGEDYVDLSTMLDGPAPPPPESDSEEDHSGSASERDEESDALSISEDDGAEAAVDKLQSLIDSLPQSSKRSLEADPASGSQKRRRIVPEQTEAWEENSFASSGIKGACKLCQPDLPLKMANLVSLHQHKSSR